MTDLISEPLKREMSTALHHLEAARQYLDQAKEAGIQCDELDARCHHLRESLLQYQQVFGKPKGRKDN